MPAKKSAGKEKIMKPSENEQLTSIQARQEFGVNADQKCWAYIKELNSCCPERLERIAVHDGYRKYTYRQMFRYWERYAEAFSGVHISGANHSRVGLIGVQQTESIFAFYGLNMTGASVSLIYHLDLYDEKRIRSMIEKEKITDLVISEIFAFPKLMKKLLRDREMLGLRNIILLESPMAGEYAISALEVVRKLNTAMFRELDGGLVMEDLLKDYEATPIEYGDAKSVDSSVVLHTTGTVSGIHKPVPMSDKALNSFVNCAIEIKATYEEFKDVPDKLVSCLALNMAWVYGMVNMLHTSFGLGMEVVCLPFGAINPNYARAIEECGISVLFTSKAMLDSWNKTMPDINLSKVKVVFMGGSYVSPDFKKSFNDYLRSCGSSARIINGYGLSEMGGACTLASSERDDDAIGFLLPDHKAKILVEDENKFYDVSDGPRTGVLCLSAPTMSTGRLDDTVIFDLVTVDGEEYFNSNDLVRVNEDGSMTCIGRSNQFFVNNAGVRFDAGLIENAITSQPDIVACGLVPEHHKILHDNVPILYAETSGSSDGLGILRDALIQVFITDGILVDTNLPSQCVLVEKIPLNSGGKVDMKRLASGSVEGRRMNIKPVKLDGRIVDILLLPAVEGEAATVGAGIPEELEDDPYNILSEIFAAIPEIKDNGFSRVLRIPGLREMVLKLTDFDVSNMVGSFGKLAPKLLKMSIDELPLPKASGKGQKGDLKSWLRSLVSMAENFEAPELPMPAPFMPPMLPLPFLPPFSAWGKAGNKEGAEKQWNSMKNNAETYAEQMRDMQKVSMEACKEQWDKAFPKYMNFRESIAATLPDEVPSLPGMPSFGISPRAFMENMNKIQKKVNEQAREQADSFSEFILKEQKNAKSMIANAVERVEKAVESCAEKEEEPAAKPAEKAIEAPAEIVVEAPEAIVVEAPAEIVVETPAEVIVETPAEVVAEAPAVKSAEASADKSPAAPAEKAPAEKAKKAPEATAKKPSGEKAKKEDGSKAKKASGKTAKKASGSAKKNS